MVARDTLAGKQPRAVDREPRTVRACWHRNAVVQVKRLGGDCEFVEYEHLVFDLLYRASAGRRQRLTLPKIT